jgi:glycosyltransferase involved in cell wall biosynthesis
MKIVIYSKHVRDVSGVQTFERAFLQKFSKLHDISYVYEVIEPNVLIEFSKICKMIRNEGQLIECDICIYSSIGQDNNNIKAKKTIQLCHTDFKTFNAIFRPRKVDLYISVSEMVKRELKINYGIESVVIKNMLPELKGERALRLMCATRISQGKGINRLLVLIDTLKANNRPFIFEIYGKGAFNEEENFKNKIKEYSEVHYFGSKMNIYDYIRANDYVVQLSDSEGYCYSIHEALSLNIPVIVTDWDGVRDSVIDGENGFILNMDLSNLDVNKFYNIPKVKNIGYDVDDIIRSWNQILSI